MLYFRPLLTFFELFKYFFLYVFSFFKLIKFHKTPNEFYFAYSRDSIKLIIQKLYQEKQRNINFFVPSFFCWEIIEYIKSDNVNIFWYDLDKNLNPIFNSIINTSDLILVVDFFGLEINIESIRKFSKTNNSTLIFDKTHCFNNKIKLLNNEFLIQSHYKHFPIPNGASLISNDIQSSEVEILYNSSNFVKNDLNILIWIFKTFVIKLFKIRRYIVNDYDLKPNFIASNNFKVEGISILSKIILKFKINKNNNLNNIYRFYNILCKELLLKFNFIQLNNKYLNSHLYAMEFNDKQSANQVYRLLKKLKIPVVSWPERKFINILPHNLQLKMKDKTDRMLFLSAFYNNQPSSKFEKRFLKKLKRML
jgi:hypothetical protein